MKQVIVNNENNEQNPVGRFMVAVGALITNSEGKILLIKRSEKLDWHPGEWELIYGRIGQFEDPIEGLIREVREEVGIKISVGAPQRVWHMYRGTEKSAYNDLIGITFTATTGETTVKLSIEHSEFRWVMPKEALKLITVESVKEDIREFINSHD